MTEQNESPRIAEIRRRLDAALAPSHLEVIDDSHLHAGHAGARDGRGHYRIRIAAAALDGLNRLAQQRSVYAALGDMMENDIHALSIKVMAENGGAAGK